MDLTLIENASQEDQATIAAISRRPVIQRDDDDTHHVGSPLWSAIRSSDKFLAYTNFFESELEELHRISLPFARRARKRGPTPKIQHSDGLLLILLFYHFGIDYEKLAHIVRRSATAVREAIARVRPILHATLADRYSPANFRPQPLTSSNFPHIGLLVDSTSLEVFRPKGRFEEQKVYYDAKNNIYSIKKEVGVMAAAPHYALFFARGEPGAIHDYTIFKKNFSQYVPYLMKQTGEDRGLEADRSNRRWGLLMDKGYYTTDRVAQMDTPGLRKITLRRGPRTRAEELENEQLGEVRVNVECFFGRLQQLWSIFRNVYRWDHDSFDADFEICAYLTNEHIHRTSLEQTDLAFYLQVIDERKALYEQQHAKRKQQLQQYRERGKRGVSTLLQEPNTAPSSP